MRGRAGPVTEISVFVLKGFHDFQDTPVCSLERNCLLLTNDLKKLFPVACRYEWHGWKWIET